MPTKSITQTWWNRGRNNSRHQILPSKISRRKEKEKKGRGRNSSSRRNLYPRYPPLGARSCGRAQKVNSSRLWASISRRSKLLPFSYLSAFVSARALSNDRPHPSPRAKSVVGIANAYIFLRNSSSFGIATFLPPTRPTAPSPFRNDLLVSSWVLFSNSVWREEICPAGEKRKWKNVWKIWSNRTGDRILDTKFLVSLYQFYRKK